MTRRLTSSTIIIALTAGGISHVLAASQNTPFIALTSLDMGLSPTANTRIGVDESGRVIAIVTDDDGQIAEIGLGTYDNNDMLVFGKATMVDEAGILVVQMAQVGGVLMLDGTALTIDPRIVVKAVHDVGLGVPLADMTAMIEGEGIDATLVFGNSADVGAGTAIRDLMLVTISGKLFAVATVGDISFVTALAKSGKTWVSIGVIGYVDGNMIADVTVSELGDEGIGITSREPVFASTRRLPADQATVAA